MRTIFNYSMSVIYLLAGVYLLVFGWIYLNTTQNIGMGLLLIAYGIFRAYRIYSAVSVSEMEQEDKANSNTTAIL